MPIEAAALDWKCFSLPQQCNGLIKVQSPCILHVLTHLLVSLSCRGEVDVGVKHQVCESLILYNIERILCLPSGHLRKWEISFSIKGTFFWHVFSNDFKKVLCQLPKLIFTGSTATVRNSTTAWANQYSGSSLFSGLIPLDLTHWRYQAHGRKTHWGQDMNRTRFSLCLEATLDHNPQIYIICWFRYL